MIPLIDTALFFLGAGVAIAQRGTWIGWLMTLMVIWQAIALIRIIRES